MVLNCSTANKQWTGKNLKGSSCGIIELPDIWLKGQENFDLKIVDILAEIWTKHLPTTSLQYYQQTSLLNVKNHISCSLTKSQILFWAVRYNLTVSAIYCPPRYCIYANEYKIFFDKLNSRLFIGGDFNAKHTHWGSRLITPKARELYKAAVHYRCEFTSTGKQTYWPADPNKTQDLIDVFVIKNISSNYIKIEENLDLNSDHSPICLTVSDNIIMKKQNPVLTNKHTDWDCFNYLL
jgi:hypothetical protein